MLSNLNTSFFFILASFLLYFFNSSNSSCKLRSNCQSRQWFSYLVKQRLVVSCLYCCFRFDRNVKWFTNHPYKWQSHEIKDYCTNLKCGPVIVITSYFQKYKHRTHFSTNHSNCFKCWCLSSRFLFYVVYNKWIRFLSHKAESTDYFKDG